MTDGAPRAAVDSGTNSTRLLVVDGQGRTLARRLTITRLGQGVDERGRLDDDALRRTLDAIAAYRDEWRRHGVDERHVRIAATSAVRDAANRDRYFDGVKQLTGVHAEVLSGDDEARLSYAGAAAALDVPRPMAVIDIGGGSTEVVVGDATGKVRAAVTSQVGSVRVTERHLRDDPPTGDQVASATAMIDEILDDVAARMAAAGGPPDSAVTLVGVAGTVTTVAALCFGQAEYDDEALHGRRVRLGDVCAWTDRLLAMPVAERRRLGAIPAGREDVIAGGALILARVLERHGYDEIVVSTADILDGLVASLK